MLRHASCARWALLAGALVVAFSWWPALAADPPPPAALQDTGVDVLGWLLNEFGIAGLVGWLVWSVSRALQRISIAAVPLVIQFHPDDRKLLVRIARLVAETDTDSDDSTPEKTR